MPDTENNATKSRLSSFIDGCSQLTEIYAVTPLDYTNIMGEWWQRINDIIYTLGLTETQNTPVTIAWTVPVPGRKRSPFHEEELGSEDNRNSTVGGSGTGQLKAHKFGLLQSIDKLFQRNIDTWGGLYEYLYTKKDSNGHPKTLTELIYGEDIPFTSTSSTTERNNAIQKMDGILDEATRGLPQNQQGLAASLQNVINNIIGTSLYDWLLEHGASSGNEGSDGIGGLEEILFGTHDRDEIDEKIADVTDGGSSSLFDKTSQIVDTIGEDLYNWLTNPDIECLHDYNNGTIEGPNSLQEMLFGGWSMDGRTVTGDNGEIRDTSVSSPSWCQIVSQLKSGGFLTEIYNIVNYLGEPYDDYVDKINKEKDVTNDSIPSVDDEYQNSDPLHKLNTLGVGQVIYGAKNSKNEHSFENDWIFKEANICTSDKEVQTIIASFKDQKKIFDTYNRISWGTTNDDPLRNTACFPKVQEITIEENGASVSAVQVDGYEMAYVTDNVYTYEGEQDSVKEVRLMPYPTSETKIENRLGELPGYKRNADGITFTKYATPQAFKSTVQKGEWFNIIEDGTYAGHVCKKDDFLLCIASGSASLASTWKVINHDIPNFVSLNASRVVPSWDTHFPWKEVCYNNGEPILLKRNPVEGETIISAPQLPYEVGDLYSIGETGQYLREWDPVKETWLGLNCNEGDVLICVNAKSADEQLAYADWNRITRANVKRDAGGHVESFYKWWPNTQIISKTTEPLIYDFWKNYEGPYSAYVNVPLFHTRDEFLSLLPQSAPEADSSDPNKSIWDPRFHEINYLGSLGKDGEFEEIPVSAKIGDAIRVEAPGKYAGYECKLNDTLVCTRAGTGVSNPSQWKNINRNLNRNYGYILSNVIRTNYGVENINSSVMYAFPSTLRKEKIYVDRLDEETEYTTVTGCSWDTDANEPTATGLLTSLIWNKEAKVHTGVSGNWTNGYTLSDAGADYSTLTVDIPYADVYHAVSNANNPNNLPNSKQFYYSMLLAWNNPIYNNETLVLKQQTLDNLETGWGNSQWVVYDGNINENTKEVTIGNPLYCINNGIRYPAIKSTIRVTTDGSETKTVAVYNGTSYNTASGPANGTQCWGIIFHNKFLKFNEISVSSRKDRPQYDTCFQVVKYSTVKEIIYRAKDGNNNTQLTYTGTGSAANGTTARNLLDNNRLHRIERVDRTTSTKKSWVFTSTQTNVKDSSTGITTRYSTPLITETETVYTAECMRARAVNTTALSANPNLDSIIGYPNKYPFTTVKWLKETQGSQLLDNTNDANFNTCQSGYYSATCTSKTTTKKWKLASNATMTWTENLITNPNGTQSIDPSSHWTINGTWVQDGKTTTTETVNRPLRMAYYWDLMYHFKYRAWVASSSYFNAGKSYYTKWMSYNISDIDYIVPSWIKKTGTENDDSQSLGIPINTISTTCPGEMNSWNIVQEGDDYVVKIGTNSTSFLALTSKKKYGEFKFDCTPASYTDDDDNLGLVACHVKDHATGIDNALVIDRWSTGMRLRFNSDVSIIDINQKPVIRNLNGAYNKTITHYAEGIHRPIITENGEIYEENEITTPYNLATFDDGGKNWTNTGMFIWKMYTQHEGPSTAGTTETVYNGIEYEDANGVAKKGTHNYQNVRKSAETMLGLINPENNNGELGNVILSRSYSPTDTNKIKAASAYNNQYGSWIVPFHTTMTADTYWTKLNTPIRNEIISCIKAMVKNSDTNAAPTNNEAISIFKNVIYPRYKLSTFDVRDLTVDDARKLHHPLQWMTTLPVDPNATTLNLNVYSYNNTASKRWIYAGYGWLNLYTGVDLNYRTIIERTKNNSTNTYDLLITYKDVLHRLATTAGTTKRKLAGAGNWTRLDNDEGFKWHKNATNNQAYKGDIMIKVWKANTSYRKLNEDVSAASSSYNFFAWQMRNGTNPVPLVLAQLDSTSYMTTLTYQLTQTGDNISVDVAEGQSPEILTDLNGVPIHTIIQSDPIYNIKSDKSTADYSTRSLYKSIDQLMTSIVSYGYLNCSNPLSEYRKIKFVDTSSGEIYDLANNAVWKPDAITNEYVIDSSKNYDVEQAIMKKFGTGRFLYNSELNHMFFTRGDTDSVQQIL